MSQIFSGIPFVQVVPLYKNLTKNLLKTESNGNLKLLY